MLCAVISGADTFNDIKSNEITAIPELLDILDIQGCTVTIDAMGCQTKIAQKILDKKDNYLFSLKGSQGNTLDTVEHLFKWEEKNGYESVQSTVLKTVCTGCWTWFLTKTN